MLWCAHESILPTCYGIRPCISSHTVTTSRMKKYFHGNVQEVESHKLSINQSSHVKGCHYMYEVFGVCDEHPEQADHITARTCCARHRISGCIVTEVRCLFEEPRRNSSKGNGVTLPCSPSGHSMVMITDAVIGVVQVPLIETDLDRRHGMRSQSIAHI